MCLASNCNHAGFHLGISSWRRSSQITWHKLGHGEGRVDFLLAIFFVGGGVQFGGEVELFGPYR